MTQLMGDRQTGQADVVAGVQLEAFGASVSVPVPQPSY
jgi:hypothetical protein